MIKFNRLVPRWIEKLPEETACDLLTVDCIAATILLLVLAALPSVWDEALYWAAEMHRWICVLALGMVLVALACLLRLARSDEQYSGVCGRSRGK